MRARTVRCSCCDVMVINNVVCHEAGCPEGGGPDPRENDELEVAMLDKIRRERGWE